MIQTTISNNTQNPISFIMVKGKKYHVKRVIPSADVTDAKSSVIKELWGCDTILQKNGFFYYCDEMPDIEYVDIDENTTKMLKNE